jgi:hypothetical protein
MPVKPAPDNIKGLIIANRSNDAHGKWNGVTVNDIPFYQLFERAPDTQCQFGTLYGVIRHMSGFGVTVAHAGAQKLAQSAVAAGLASHIEIAGTG